MINEIQNQHFVIKKKEEEQSNHIQRPSKANTVTIRPNNSNGGYIYLKPNNSTAREISVSRTQP
jgi:hypothetical protein